MEEEWGGGNDNLGFGNGRGRGAPPMDTGFGFGGGHGGRGGGGAPPMDTDFGSGGGRGGRGRGGGAPPMDTDFGLSSARGGRGRGVPSMDADFGPGSGRGRGVPSMEADFGPGSGRGRGVPSMEADFGPGSGRGRGVPSMEADFGPGSGRGRGVPSMEADFGPGSGRGRGVPSMEADFGPGSGRGRGVPSMEADFGPGSGRGRGVPSMEADFGPGSGRGRGVPSMEADFGPGSGRGRGVPSMEADFGPGSGRGRGVPSMDTDSASGGWVPTKRPIEEILEEDARVKDRYNTIREEDENVTVTGPFAEKYQEFENWSNFEFDPALMANIQKSNYTFPRKIQSVTFPLIKDGHDLKGHAETGSGKSAAFLLPIIDAVIKLKKGELYKSRRSCPFALILEPTRELTVQVYDQARKLSAGCDVSVSRAYGMFQRHVNLRQISTDGCDILVGTPGRICDYFQNKELLCNNLKVLVFDEADQLLEDGFQASLRQLNNISNWPNAESRQTLLFSATFPLVVQTWADEWMRKDSMMVSNKRLVAANARIKQRFLNVNGRSKKDVLLRLFQLELQTEKKRDPVNGKIRSTMVFVNTKRDADVVSSYLNQFSFNTTTINGNRPQEMREKALSDFRAGVYQIVVTTDVCARGHDLKDLDHVINMDLPASGEGIDDSFTTYVHRIGRTGRLRQGFATTFFDIDKDLTMAQGFVKGLQEANQPVPDWLNKLAAGEPVIGSGQLTDEELLGIL